MPFVEFFQKRKPPLKDKQYTEDKQSEIDESKEIQKSEETNNESVSRENEEQEKLE